MSYKGTYKGNKFRSLMELSFMLLKESEGHIIGETLLYEKLSVYYKIGKNGRDRKYIIDFYDEKNKIAYEVKPASRVNNRINVAKAKAAREHLKKCDIIYKIVCEADIKKLITYKEAKLIKDVSFKMKRKKRAK